MPATFRSRQKTKRVPLRSKPVSKTRKKIRSRNHPKWNSNLAIGVMAVAIISIVLTLISKFYTTEYFKISELEFIGSQSVPIEDLNNDLAKYLSANIFLTNKSKVEDTLLDKYVYFEEVKIRKIWPNKLYINIYEREPTLLMINLNGVYVIDEDARIIDVIITDPINISDSDLDVINGVGDPNADYIAEIIQADWEENNPTLDVEEFNFAEIAISQKLETLYSLQGELTQLIDSQLTVLNIAASETKYANLQQVIIYENKEYKEFDFINENILDITQEVINYFRVQKDILVESVYWRGNYLLVVQFVNGQKVIFGATRSIADQIEDYVIVTNQLSFTNKPYTEINLSSKKVSVR